MFPFFAVAIILVNMQQTMTIFLEKQQVFAHIGWGDAERIAGVTLEIDVKVSFLWSTANDNLIETLDYGALVKIVQLQSAVECKLLETLAERIQKSVLDISGHYAQEIVVKICKPKIPVDGYNAKCAGIELVWFNPHE